MTKGHMVTVLAALALLVAACSPAATATPIPTQPPAATRTPTSGAANATPAATPLPRATPTPTPTAAPAGPKVKGTLRYPIRGDPTGWDRASIPQNRQNTIYSTAVYTNMFTDWSDEPRACTSNLYPVAVESWRWVDDTTAEFTLKRGIRFQNKPPVNGREATAEDFAKGFRRYQTWADVAARVERVESVTVKDRYTVQMKLKYTWGGFWSELLRASNNGPWLEAPEAGGPDGKLFAQPEKWVGSGPFMFHSYRPGVGGRLVRNPDYWVEGRPYLEAVEYPVIPDSSTIFAAFVAGKVNLVEDMAEEHIEVAAKSLPGPQVARCPGLRLAGVGGLYMNNTGPPFNDVRVRRAVQTAIDQQTIIDKLYRGKGVVNPVFPSAFAYPMVLADFPPEVRQHIQYNPTLAKQLLADAGYPNGFDTAINFTARYPAPSMMVAEMVADMLTKVGIRAKLLIYEYARFSALVGQLDPPYPVGEMALYTSSAASPESPTAFPGYHSTIGGRSNRSLVKDPEYDRLFEEFVVTLDEKRRAELARQLQIMIASKAYSARLPWRESVMVGVPGLHFRWVGNISDYSMLVETAWMD